MAENRCVQLWIPCQLSHFFFLMGVTVLILQFLAAHHRILRISYKVSMIYGLNYTKTANYIKDFQSCDVIWIAMELSFVLL